MQFQTSQFHWSPDLGLFSQELSSLGVRPTQNAFHQLFPDACDQGITLISEVTNKEAHYYVDKVDQTLTEDGWETHGWNLLPTSETIRRMPRLKNTRVLVNND